jgi:hypothetical protein
MVRITMNGEVGQVWGMVPGGSRSVPDSQGTECRSQQPLIVAI